MGLRTGIHNGVINTTSKYLEKNNLISLHTCAQAELGNRSCLSCLYLNIFLIGDLEAIAKNSKHDSMMKFISSHMYIPNRTQSVYPLETHPLSVLSIVYNAVISHVHSLATVIHA